MKFNFKKIYRQKREAYFILFFAMLITMLMIPIMNQVLIETIETRDGISQHQKSSNLLILGNSALKSKLEQLSQKGLGYYESGSFDIEGVGTINFDYSAASTEPVPTEKTLSDLYGPLHETWPGGAPNINEFYSVPALGTGNSSESECSPEIIANTKYPGTDILVDPLDHPCNWNTLARGENVTIPLYTQSQELAAEGKYLVQKPSMMLLRIRLKCADGSELCDPEDRLEFWDEGLEEVDRVIFDDSTLDFTNQVIGWLVKGEKTFIPNSQSVLVADGESGRHFYNNEVTALRLKNPSVLESLYTFEHYFESEGTSIVDLTRINGFNIVDEAECFAGLLNLFGDDFESFACSVEDFVAELIDDEALIIEKGWEIENSLPELILGFTKNRVLACRGGVECGLQHRDLVPSSVLTQEVFELEYQLLTDVQIGNDKYWIEGSLDTLTGDVFYLDKSEKKGPKTTSPGSVFST